MICLNPDGLWGRGCAQEEALSGSFLGRGWEGAAVRDGTVSSRSFPTKAKEKYGHVPTHCPKHRGVQMPPRRCHKGHQPRSKGPPADMSQIWGRHAERAGRR